MRAALANSIEPESLPLDQILDLPEPWRVARVWVDAAESCVRVSVEPVAGATWPCPRCAARLPGHIDGPEHVWRHLDVCRRRTLLVARIARVTCPLDGTVDVAVPWADDHIAGYTAEMARQIADRCGRGGVTAAAHEFGIHWSQAWAVMMSKRIGV
jgi:transposase